VDIDLAERSDDSIFLEIPKAIGSLCKEFERYGVKSLFIAYNDFTPEERSVYDIAGPRFHILDPFTYLRITATKASGLSPEFSRYLAASGHEERLRLSPQIKKFRKVQFLVRGMCGCSDDLREAWKCI
jgi:hypothetical protein